MESLKRFFINIENQIGLTYVRRCMHQLSSDWLQANVLVKAFHLVFYINYDDILFEFHIDRKSWGLQMNKLAMKLISSY